MSPAPRFVGSEVKRLEDPRLLRGQAQYVDDLTLSGLAHGHVLGSPYAHARIVRLDTAEAEKLPGASPFVASVQARVRRTGTGVFLDRHAGNCPRQPK
ncbi:MAG: hypothetical protein AUH29_15235 [Candidatus Rokubacteria bacterium 13_1_40CM_69_27]|nr:MAG: hypothetical protein AUH29_15235 [Candidatus Rokubacteria bacterium 13_1_40CM_69_27]